MKERGLVLCDLDGTIIDPHRGAPSYEDSAYQFISRKIGVPRNELDARMQLLKEHVLSNQEIYGWKINGLIVSPPADFIIVNQAAAELLVTQLSEEKSRFLSLPKEKEMDEFINEIFKNGASGMKTFFREGAGEFVKKLSQEGRFAIVTNSSTERATEKIKELVGENEIPIYGGAKKMVVDVNWEEGGIPLSQKPDGFPVTEYLRRPKYFAILNERKPQVVIGDIRQLDLILPEFMGIYTALALSKYTPSWEIPHHTNNKNSVTFNEFQELDL